MTTRPRRRRRWPLFLPLGLVAGLVVAWCGFWYFAAGKAQADASTAGARARPPPGASIPAHRRTIGGFPFRIEVRCVGPTTELRSNQPPLVLKANELLAAVQVYDPTLLITEFSGPLTIAEPGQPPGYSANWTLAQSSLRGTPGGAGTRLDRGRRPGRRPPRRGRQRHGAQGAAARIARPPGRRLRDQQSGDRGGAARRPQRQRRTSIR